MKTIARILFLTVLVNIALVSCKKDRDEEPTPVNPTSLSLHVAGTVVDIYGNPLSDVTVTIGTQSFTTNYNGTFYFANVSVPVSRFNIRFEKQGYFPLERSGIPQSGKPIVLNVGLISENDFNYAASKSFSSTQQDSIVLPDGSTIVFPANAFITSNGSAYSGTVNVKACYLDPTWEKYGMFCFGGDIYAKSLDNQEVYLDPFAALNVIITDNAGNKLQLDSINQKKATVKMQIPAPLVADAPSTITTWEYASAQGIKREKGDATKVGDKYMGTVAHFSFWSFERKHTGKAEIYGYIKKYSNGDSVGIAGVKVKIGKQIVITDKDGKYEAFVPDNISNITIVPLISSINPIVIQTPLQNSQSKRVDFDLTGLIYIVKGTVKNYNGTNVPNAMVSSEWYSSVIQKVTTFTNNYGMFVLPIEQGAYYTTIIAKTPTQSTSISLYSLQNDTTIEIRFPAIPGINKLVVDNNTIFSITGHPQNAEISGFMEQNQLSIYVHNPNYGMFSIYNAQPFTSLQTNQNYSIPSDFNVQYGTQQMQTPANLSSGTITFTKVPASSGQLIEGLVNGVDSTGKTVTINFSVPI